MVWQTDIMSEYLRGVQQCTMSIVYIRVQRHLMRTL